MILYQYMIEKWDQTDSPKIPDREETSEIPSLTSGVTQQFHTGVMFHVRLTILQFYCGLLPIFYIFTVVYYLYHPDITIMVDWALKINYLSIYLLEYYL